MLIETNREELLRITQTLNCSSTLSTSFEYNGFMFEITRKDYYIEQRYKKIPFPEKKV